MSKYCKSEDKDFFDADVNLFLDYSSQDTFKFFSVLDGLQIQNLYQRLAADQKKANQAKEYKQKKPNSSFNGYSPLEVMTNGKTTDEFQRQVDYAIEENLTLNIQAAILDEENIAYLS